MHYAVEAPPEAAALSGVPARPSPLGERVLRSGHAVGSTAQQSAHGQQHQPQRQQNELRQRWLEAEPRQQQPLPPPSRRRPATPPSNPDLAKAPRLGPGDAAEAVRQQPPHNGAAHGWPRPPARSWVQLAPAGSASPPRHPHAGALLLGRASTCSSGGTRSFPSGAALK